MGSSETPSPPHNPFDALRVTHRPPLSPRERREDREPPRRIEGKVEGHGQVPVEHGTTFGELAYPSHRDAQEGPAGHLDVSNLRALGPGDLEYDLDHRFGRGSAEGENFRRGGRRPDVL